MLDVRNLGVSYGGTPVIEDLSFRLEGSDILMLVGPTGCGKTTVLRALAGLVRPSSGEIQIGSRRITAGRDVPPEKRRVGMVFQDFALFPHLSVINNVSFRLKDKRLALDWLDRLGLMPVRDAMPETLSGGQKQRVALARALAHEPRLMLLDEPLSNLDAALKDTLRWDIREALEEAGVPAVWVTHDQEEALSVGDQLGILNRGRLEQLDTPEHCFSMPQSRFTANFLGEAAFVRGKLRANRVETPLGNARVRAVEGATDEVDLMVRPDDLSLTPAEAGNGRVTWSRYEGETRLYAVRIDDGEPLRVRTNHEVDLPRGSAVNLHINAEHTLAAFLPVGRDSR
ncbi:iron(III) transport system ATP-binding protein [Halospina denitrificans]|uniref:Iron(III) transport system ATP-binding protein n=1 Tax=Halospina denitrificans TaxID=332522 RepID=A0A4R7JY04_9GAMM|nr:ABC transporter ATP-binding protein [Halospina denitrificans]TDT42946.1 iron(III) transport system ATP-binding protein [Halospina denitrificans]